MRIASCLIAFALMGSAAAVTVPELLTEVDQGLDPASLADPNDTKRAEAIAELLTTDLGLAPAEVLELRLVLGEAWAGCGQAQQAYEVLGAILKQPGIDAGLRERTSLAWIAAWQAELSRAEKPETLAAPSAALAAFGPLTPRVAARAATAEAERELKLEKPAEAIALYDRALAQLAGAPAGERVPVYVLRLLAMEARGDETEAIQGWLAANAKDPAMVQVVAAALTTGQKLVGQPAPALKAKRLDGQPGQLDLAQFKGKPVLLDFFASWCKPCEAVAPTIATLAAKYQAQGVVTIGISLDTPDTMANLPGFLAKHGMQYPVIGEGVGWDGELDDQFHVDGIPALILVGADGRIAAVDLIGGTPEATAKQVAAAIEETLRGPAPQAQGAIDTGEVLP